MNQDTNHVSPVWTRIFNIFVERGEGAYVYAVDGTRYMDFTCGIGVTNTGHCHPEVVKAAQDQVGKFIHAQVNMFYHKPLLELVDMLRDVTPPAIDTFFFSNSGAEAVEGAVKLAKHATGRQNVIVFEGSFHGRTHLTMAMTTSSIGYRQKYQPLPGGIFVSPYPYAFRLGMDEEETARYCLKQLRHLLASQTSPAETAAIIIEPVLGEGGYVVPSRAFMQGLRELCSEHGILLIADEVQSGFGRTGKFFAIEHFDLEPDILVMAKGLASGFPLSCVASRRALMEKWITGSHGGTYGGNPVACAAAVATVRLLKNGLVDNAVAMGSVLMSGLRNLQSRYPVIGDVRGLGLMIGTEFVHEDGSPATAFTKAVVTHCREERLLLLNCGTYHNTVRWIPPLIVTQEQIHEGLAIFERAIQKASA